MITRKWKWQQESKYENVGSENVKWGLGSESGKKKENVKKVESKILWRSKWKWQKERKPAYSENGEYKWKGGHRNDIGTEKGMNVRNMDGRLVEL